MRLYLSSFRLGTSPERFVALAAYGARVAVIANAIDDEPGEVRHQKTEDEIRALHRLGLRPEELDLRGYFGANPDEMVRAINGFGALWVRGGNVFVLRAALAASGADAAIQAALAEDRVVYGGYSAGPCVLGPSLQGLEDVDDPSGPQLAYGLPTLMTGLGVLDFCIVPHADTDTLEGEAPALVQLAHRYENAGVPHLRLRDGEALLIDGDQSTIVGKPVPAEQLLYESS